MEERRPIPRYWESLATTYLTDNIGKMVTERGFPASGEAGWLRGAQTGWCWQRNGFSWSTPPRPLLSEEAVAIFSWCRGHPSSAEEGKHVSSDGSPRSRWTGRSAGTFLERGLYSFFW